MLAAPRRAWSTTATAAFDGYDYARALERTEAFFWSFCDDYVELVKDRAYGARARRRRRRPRPRWRIALSVLLRLFAPFLPFVTEEVWSWWQEGSVHRAAWPTAAELPGRGGDPALRRRRAADVLAGVRKAKTEAKVSMRADVADGDDHRPGRPGAAGRGRRSDLVDSGRIATLSVVAGEGPLVVNVVLAPVAE